MKTEEEHYKDKDKLVEIAYQLVLTCLSEEFITHFQQLSIPERANWVTEQLKSSGFNTKPIGSRWGVLEQFN